MQDFDDYQAQRRLQWDKRHGIEPRQPTLRDLTPTGSNAIYATHRFVCPDCHTAFVRRIDDLSSVETVLMGAVYVCANCVEDPPEFSRFVPVGGAR